MLETLPNLSLARPGLPRAADRRLDPQLLVDLLADPATHVVELRGDRVEVIPERPIRQARGKFPGIDTEVPRDPDRV